MNDWNTCVECKRKVWRTIDGKCEECLGIVSPLFPHTEEEEITLTFKGPETDFDMAQVEAALHWLAEKYTKNTRYDWTGQSDEAAMRSIYALLLTIQHQYAEKLGQPDWKLPPLA
jgi:hypothetical protein